MIDTRKSVILNRLIITEGPVMSLYILRTGKCAGAVNAVTGAGRPGAMYVSGIAQVREQTRRSGIVL